MTEAEKQASKAFHLGVKHGIEIVKTLGKINYLLFAEWLVAEGYLIDAEKEKDLDIKDLYQHWKNL